MTRGAEEHARVPPLMGGSLRGLRALSRGFSTDALQEAVLSLPKFEIKLTTDLLAALGLEDGMRSETTLAGFAPNLYIAGAPHRTVISDDEDGTKAATVIGVIAIKRSSIVGVMRIDVD